MSRKILITLFTIFCLISLLVACDTGDPKTETESTETLLPTTEETITPVATPETTSKEDEKVDTVYETVTNPLVKYGADPWVIEHNGQYFYCFSDGVNKVSVSRFDDLNKISTDDTKLVYTAPAGTNYSLEYWAPELHYIKGEWYIYVAADDGNNANHRMYVLKGTSQDPQDPFKMVGVITDPTNKWAIDGTILELGDELYFIWSGWKGDTNVSQNIYIAHMSDPCTIDSERVMLSMPLYTWEKQGTPYVNEGPTILKHDDDVFLLYSASGSWTDDYCLGMLTFKGGDPLDPNNWKKSNKPVFKKTTEVFGPGHCSFAPACDGSIWMIYHANLVSGSSWGGRSVWIAPVTFEENGKPIFGTPSKTVQFPSKEANNK